MDKLKVAFLDFWPEIKDENIFLPILQKHFDVEVTTSNPDVVIHSIFGASRELLSNASQYKCKKILFLGENARPQNYHTNYSISFDPHSDTNYRLPLWQFYLILRPELKDLLFGPRINHEEFNRFCSFVVSNGTNFVRNGFFHQLTFEYSHTKIYSYGRYLRNDNGLDGYSQGRYWRDAKFDFFKYYKHRYAIAFENNSYPYYCTEKLMDAFLGGSMPIYWGDPKVKEDWNVNAFINANKGSEHALNQIKEMQKDKSVFEAVYHEPIFTDEQHERHLNNMEGFETWLIETIKK